MERSLLDTDTFSEVLRERDLAVSKNARQYLAQFGVFTLSVITVAEVIDGFRRRNLQSHIDRLLSKIQAEGHEVLALHFEAAKLAGLIFGDLHRAGQPIGRADPFIAAIAIQASIPLVTGNTQHFERIQALGYSLRLDNWRALAG
jgi:tRNA(fMet)-specific endonuclease VapC